MNTYLEDAYNNMRDAWLILDGTGPKNNLRMFKICDLLEEAMRLTSHEIALEKERKLKETEEPERFDGLS